MALGSIGLQTHIWNNEIKSWFLLLSYPFLLLFMLWAFFFGLVYFTAEPHLDAGMAYLSMGSDPFSQAFMGIVEYGAYVFAAVAIWFTIAFFFHQQMIDRTTGAQKVSRTEQPTLYNMLENLCISRGLPMPGLRIIDTDALNAYASGLSNRSYCVTVTRGLLETLSDEELEAVLAHELSHIRHHDVRLLVISVIFVGMISFLCEMAFRSLRYGRGVRMSGGNRKGGGAILVALAVLAIGYIFSLLIRFALSRRREYLADAGAVELTKNPNALISALQKISTRSAIADATDDVKQMFIENATPFMGIFATHPRMDDRIAALVLLGGTPPTPESAAHGPWR